MTEMSIWVPVIGTILGALVGGGISYFINKTNKESDERKHIQSLIFSAALDHWKAGVDYAKQSSRPVNIAPLTSSILLMMKFHEIMIQTKTTTQDIPSKLMELKEFWDILDKNVSTLYSK